MSTEAGLLGKPTATAQVVHSGPTVSNRKERAIKEMDVLWLSFFYFRFIPTEGEEDIIRTIAFATDPRVIINCVTRYGKTQCVAVAVCLYILLNHNKKVRCIGPRYDTTAILRNYIADLIVECSDLAEMIETQVRGIARIKKQLSRKRITFSNGCELLILSAEGSAQRLMGIGGDLVIIDESCQIKKEVYTGKISRMLGDSETAVLVEISNPTSRDNHYFEHWMNPKFKRIHIGWQQALDEGRVSVTFLQEQAPVDVVIKHKGVEYRGLGGISPLEWTVLYESNFPAQSEDALFNADKIDIATRQNFEWVPENRVLGCDPADKGRDLTVIWTAWTNKNKWKFFTPYSETISDQMDVANRLLRMQQAGAINQIKVDYGMGVGIISAVKSGLLVKHCRVFSCQFGSSPVDKVRFLNKKAEMYWFLKTLFDDELIQIPAHDTTIKQLLSMKWKYTMGNKIQIIDPEDKSPDFADALVVSVWKVNTGASFYIA